MPDRIIGGLCRLIHHDDGFYLHRKLLEHPDFRNRNNRLDGCAIFKKIISGPFNEGEICRVRDINVCFDVWPDEKRKSPALVATGFN